MASLFAPQVDRLHESHVHSLDQLTEMVHTSFYELDCRYTTPDRCHTRALAAKFKDSLVSMVDTTPAMFRRTDGASSRSDAGTFKIMWQITGQSCIQQGGREAMLVPGTWAVYDSTRPYSVNVLDEDSRFVVLFLPQNEAYAWGPAIPRLLGTALSGKGTAEVALSAIGRLLDDQVTLDSAGQMVVQDSVVALMAAAMRQTGNSDASAQSRVMNPHKLEQIREFILEHISEPDLSAERIAQAFSMSRRSLYYLFDRMGETPHAYILGMRLEAARKSLADPREADKTITQLAYEFGFSDAAHLSRAFHERFGVSPSGWRAHRRM
ncbi:helix-turn-helix domain-containing protein [Noviherbaspirillum sp.]|jgi:AraC-like DNA-binding protein|uniref:helix-turn-helix domain-containing protein n=1 Tax=Noviherbaspirillum sp. TaxID=1926288 RepID=UPI0025CD762B|nr:helix-turn-helix domain-containing protein [Noviherbaspirillum sp.]